MTNAYQSTSLVVMFKAFLASDHVTEATGKTIAITISKNGGAFGNPNAGATNATEVSSGWYKFTLDTTDTNTVGPLAYRGAAATIDDVGGVFYVVAAPPTAAVIADAVWDEDATAHQTTGTFGQAIGDPADWGDTSIRNDLDYIATYLPNAGSIAAGVLAEIVEGTITVGDSFRLWNAALGGKASGLGTATAVFRDLGDTKDRIVATVDVDGNRSAVTRDLT